MDVLRACAEGDSYQQASDRLYLSIRTVNKHLEHAREKLGAHNTVHAVAIAMRKGLIE